MLAATERRCRPRSRESAVGREPGDVETVGCVWRMAEVEPEPTHEASFSGSFMESFMTLNIINFADVARRENDEVLWDVRIVSSP